MLPDPDTLSNLTVFQSLTLDELEKISAFLVPTKVVEGENLIVQGEPATRFYIVLNGNFMIYDKDYKARTLHGQSSQLIGWSSVASQLVYDKTAVALTDGEVLLMPSDKFLDLIQSNASLGDRIMKNFLVVLASQNA